MVVVNAEEATASLRADEVVYADDLAVLAVARAREAADLVKATGRLTANMLNSLYGFGLVPNLGPSQTAALLAPCGRGARRVRHELYTRQHARIPILLENASSVLLDVVPGYQHLGQRIVWSASMDEEVCRRMMIAKAVFREGRKLVYCCKRVQLDRRATLFRGHVLATLHHGAGIWSTLSAKALAAQIFAAVGLLSPQHLLHVERLRFAALLYRTAPDVVWALAGADDAFVEAMRCAFSWLFNIVSATTALPDPSASEEAMASWLAFSAGQRGKWKGMLKHALGLAQQHHQLRAYFVLCVREVWPEKQDPSRPALAC